MAVFTERLSALRIEQKALQKDIAEAIGVTVRAYQYYEKGQKEPTLSVLIALAEFYNVSLDYLVGRSDNPKRR